MSLSYQDVFNLRSDFTMEDLNQAYDDKIRIARKEIKNEVDRQLYYDSLVKYYEEARKDLYHSQSESNMFDYNYNSDDPFKVFDQFPKIFGNMDSMMNRAFENFDKNYSSSSSYSERTLPDGSKLIIENNSLNKNGDLRKNTNSYRRLRDGRTEPVDYDEAMKLFGLKNQKYLM